MKAKKLLKRVMESRSDKKVAKKIRKRNNKFLSKLYFSHAKQCPCDELADCVVPTKNEYVAWAQEILKNGSGSISIDDVSDPVKAVSIIAVEFQFWDATKDPVKVFTTTKDDAVQNIVKSAEVVFSTVDTIVDPEPKQTQQ